MRSIGQQLMIGLSGLSLTKDEAEFMVRHDISGVTLFARNVKDPQQLHSLCTEIQELRHRTESKAPFYIAIDMEGGRVARLKRPFTVWPPLARLGDLDSPHTSFEFSHAMGRELRAVGINLDFAPCVDVFTNPKNTVIGDRAVSTDAEMVAKHASALVRGYLKAGVIPCAKHFPGHGNTLLDSHEALPVEDATPERLEQVELVPFKKAFKARVPMVMTAHILFSKIDSEWPVTLSEIFLKQFLRQELKFRNLIVTDDLDMKALSANYDRQMLPVRALQAGADILLYCNEADSPPLALESIEKALVDGLLPLAGLEESQRRILANKKEFLADPAPPSLPEATQIIGHANHQKVADCIAAGQPAPKLTSDD